MDGDDHLARQPPRPGTLQGDLAAACARRGGHRGGGPRTRRRGQGGHLDRRRPARDGGAWDTAAHGTGVADGQPRRRRDHALPRRGDPAGGARQPGRARPRRQLVHAARRSARALHSGRSGAVQQVRRARQQPRLLHGLARRDREHEPGDVPRVVPADRLQPPPDRSAGHGDVRPALPRSAQPQPRPHHHHQPRPGRLGHAPPHGRRGQGRHDDAPRRQLLDLVERWSADHALLPQHDRPADRDHRTPHADRDPLPSEPPDHARRPAAAGESGRLALPPVGGLLADGEPGRARLRIAQPRAPALQHLAHGRELDRSGQPRFVDGAAEVDRPRRRRGRSARLAGRLRGAPAGPRQTETPAATSCPPTSAASPPRPGSSTRCSRTA